MTYEQMLEEGDDHTLNSGFGLDPHVLPQFDLLVEDGMISREYADQVIAEREAAGLPMTPGELRPRPAPLVDDFAWVAAFGGPEICSHHSNGEIAIDDLVWRWRAFGGVSARYNSISHHFRDTDGKHLGWMSISKEDAGNSICWDRTLIIDCRPGDDGQDELQTVSSRGSASNIAAAISACQSWNFQPIEIGGFTWYKTADSEFKVSTADDSMRVYLFEGNSAGEVGRWRWCRKSKKLGSLLDIVGDREISGWAADKDQAIAEAIGVVDRVIGAAIALAGQQDQDAYEAGRLAGRAELKCEIAGLR